MSDRLQQLALFVRAVETGSFSKTAKEFGMSQPSVSRNIAELEARMGTRLLLRSTHKLTMTDAGQAYFPRARDILSELEDAEGAAKGADSVSGTLRIALPVAFGTREIVPLLKGFVTLHPAIKVDMLMSDRFEDLIAENIDLALRLGHQPAENLVTRRLATAPRMLVASPDYLAARGRPTKLSDLKQHECIRGPADLGMMGWTFWRGDEATTVPVEGRFHMSSGGGVIACAVEGLGIAAASMWMCRTELTNGTLVPLLPDYTMEPVDAYVVFPAGRRPSPKARAFSDYLESALQPKGAHLRNGR